MSSTTTPRETVGIANGGLCSIPGPISGDLLRRLGEAEKGYNDGKPHWFVARFKSMDGAFDVHTCFSAEEAIQVMAKLTDPNSYGIFGPFISEVSVDGPIPLPNPEPCGQHGSATGGCEGGVPMISRAASLSELLASVTKVTRVEVTWENALASGTQVIDPTKYDAIFWGTTSVKKFVIPYYAGSNSLAYAVKVHNSFFVDGAYVLAHSPDSEYKVSQAGAGQGGGGPLVPVE